MPDWIEHDTRADGRCVRRSLVFQAMICSLASGKQIAHRELMGKLISQAEQFKTDLNKNSKQYANLSGCFSQKPEAVIAYLKRIRDDQVSLPLLISQSGIDATSNGSGAMANSMNVALCDLVAYISSQHIDTILAAESSSDPEQQAIIAAVAEDYTPDKILRDKAISSQTPGSEQHVCSREAAAFAHCLGKSLEWDSTISGTNARSFYNFEEQCYAEFLDTQMKEEKCQPMEPKVEPALKIFIAGDHSNMLLPSSVIQKATSIQRELSSSSVSITAAPAPSAVTGSPTQQSLAVSSTLWEDLRRVYNSGGIHEKLNSRDTDEALAARFQIQEIEKYLPPTSKL